MGGQGGGAQGRVNGRSGWAPVCPTHPPMPCLPDEQTPNGEGHSIQSHHAAAGSHRQQLRGREQSRRVCGGGDAGVPHSDMHAQLARCAAPLSVHRGTQLQRRPSPAPPPPLALNTAMDSGTPRPTDTCATATRPWLGNRAAAASPMKPPSWREWGVERAGCGSTLGCGKASWYCGARGCRRRADTTRLQHLSPLRCRPPHLRSNGGASQEQSRHQAGVEVGEAKQLQVQRVEDQRVPRRAAPGTAGQAALA